MSNISTDSSKLSKLYAFRILIDLAVSHDLFPRDGVLSSRATRVAKSLGVLKSKANVYKSPEDDEFDDVESGGVRVKKDLLPVIRKAHKALEEELRAHNWQAPESWYPGHLYGNLKSLERLISLSDSEKKVLTFTTLLHGDQLVNRCARHVEDISKYLIYDTISKVLKLPEDAIREVLSPRSLLLSSGFLSLENDRFNKGFEHYIQPLSDSFVHNMIDLPCKDMEMFKEDWRIAPPATLSLDDYAHVSARVRGLIDYLEYVRCHGQVGCNVLIYGPPGTGKSELARLVGKTLSLSVMEVSCEGEDGRPTSGDLRLRSLRSAQVLLAKQSCLLVFDEVEDIFGYSTKFKSQAGTPPPKAWLNQSLEECQVPTVWICNSVASMDPALIRRFDLVLHLDNPPERGRRERAALALSKYVDEKTLRAAACHRRLSPAIIQRSAKVIEALATKSEKSDFTEYWSDQVNQTLVAQGFNPLPKQSNAGPFERFDLGLINCTENLEVLTSNLKNEPRGRLLFYGPPGTGKTAYGKWLADHLDMPILLLKASDLLGMYVGETERRIADTFNEAARTNSLLMFDEVDSFLQDRQDAQRSWEVTAVNEFLTQMECFDGLLLASTNLSESIDQAAFRRFDLKAKLAYMTKPQLLLAIRRVGDLLGLDMTMDDIELGFAVDRVKINDCTPGDLAAILRQNRFNPIGSVKALLDRIADDLRFKRNGSGAIGF